MPICAWVDRRLSRAAVHAAPVRHCDRVVSHCACVYVYVCSHSPLCDRGWLFVQPLLSSSYGGFGTSSLAQDSEELSELLGYLRDQYNTTDVVFIGHSTGCQVRSRYAREGELQYCS